MVTDEKQRRQRCPQCQAKTKNWQTEILNKFVYNHLNGFLKENNHFTLILNKTGVAVKNFKRLARQYKGIGVTYWIRMATI